MLVHIIFNFLPDMSYTIEIDCAPGSSRPDSHLIMMCNILGLDYNQFVIKSKSFGNWEWQVEKSYEDDYKLKQTQVESHLTKLYNTKQIRYASW